MVRASLFLSILFLCFVTSSCYSQHSQLIDPIDKKSDEVGDAYTWDFGEAREGAVLKHNFLQLHY